MVQSNIEEQCKKFSTVTSLLNSNDLQTVNQTYSSEYVYDIYLNGYLIKTGTIGGGVSHAGGLPLKNGSNELKIVVGKSYKNILGDDPFSQLAQSIIGLEYSLSVGEKELVSVKITQPNTTLTKTFSYQK